MNTLRRPCELRIIRDPFRDMRPLTVRFRDFEAYCIARQQRWRRKLSMLERVKLRLHKLISGVNHVK